MRRIFTVVFLLVVALGQQVYAEETRNCPIGFDQLIVVYGQPVAFQLHVENYNAQAAVSIFQYPLGGILEQDGPTPLDFVFVPTADFRGTTTFTYRLSLPDGCASPTQLKTVTFAGAPAE